MAHFLPDGVQLPNEVRLATVADVSFLNHLQSRFSHQLGYLPLVALEKRCETHDVWIGFENGQPAGYILGRSPYLRRADLAIIYQSAIEYDARRKLIGTLLVEAWVRSLPATVTQVTCWCAQDIDANLFWESLGFLPIAWRAGSVSKQRVHIYWNRPLLDDLAELWVPEQTANGLMRGPREVHLLEPGQDWNDPIRPNWSGIEATLTEVKAAAEVRGTAKRNATGEKRAALNAARAVLLQEAFIKQHLGRNALLVGGRPRLL